MVGRHAARRKKEVSELVRYLNTTWIFGAQMDGWMDSKGFEYIYMNLLWGGKEHGVEIYMLLIGRSKLRSLRHSQRINGF